MKNMSKGRLGFTLIELLVVVIIVGILAAIALPQYQKAILRSKFAGLLVSINAIRQAQQVYYLANGNYATSLEDLDISVDGTVYAYTENSNSNAECVAQAGATRTGVYIRCVLYVPKKRELTNNIVTLEMDVATGAKRCYAKQATNYKGTFLCQGLLPNVQGQYLWGEANYGFVEEGFLPI